MNSCAEKSTFPTTPLFYILSDDPETLLQRQSTLCIIFLMYGSKHVRDGRVEGGFFGRSFPFKFRTGTTQKRFTKKGLEPKVSSPLCFP